MKLTTLFIGTRGVRYPSLDVVRGFMLLLVTLANIPLWTDMTHASAPSDTVDMTWLWARSLLIDLRAYPLFAMLFGFGLVTVANRRIASGATPYLSSLSGVEDGCESTSRKATWACEQAIVDARCLVRRRGLWTILFGAVHAVLFSNGITGPYGLVAVIFAGRITRKYWKRALAFCAVAVVAGTTTFLNMGSFLVSQGTSVTDAHQEADASTGTVLSYILDGLLAWGGSLASALPSFMIVPAIFLGAHLADTDLITHSKRHRRFLAAVGPGGLGLGTAGGIGFVIWAVDGPLVAWTMPLHAAMGVTRTCGWLALLTLYADGSRLDGRLTGLHRLASSMGHRSMTAYLSQTFLFAIIFMVLPVLTGIELHLDEARAAGIALVVWLVIVGLRAASECGGHAGPFETLLRTTVACSERRRRLSAPPALAIPVLPVGTSNTYDLVR